MSKSVKEILTFLEYWLKQVNIWSVFWVKVSIFEKVPTHFSKCVFLDYGTFDKHDFIYAKMAKNDTLLAKKWPKFFFFKKRRTTPYRACLVQISAQKLQ